MRQEPCDFLRHHRLWRWREQPPSLHRLHEKDGIQPDTGQYPQLSQLHYEHAFPCAKGKRAGTNACILLENADGNIFCRNFLECKKFVCNILEKCVIVLSMYRC